MKESESIIAGYAVTSRLKTIERSGWHDCGIIGRAESDAEHSNSGVILAYLIKSHFPKQYADVNIERVALMFSFHDTVELFMPDYTPYSDITREEKTRQTNEAIRKVSALFPDNGFMYNMLTEFEDGKTTDAHFARMVDKLDAALQCRIYDKNGKFNYNNEKTRREHVRQGKISDLWLAREAAKKEFFDGVFLGILKTAQDT